MNICRVENSKVVHEFPPCILILEKDRPYHIDTSGLDGDATLLVDGKLLNKVNYESTWGTRDFPLRSRFVFWLSMGQADYEYDEPGIYIGYYD